MGNLVSQVNSNVLLKAAVVDVGIQWGCCALAVAFKTEKFFDLAGSSTFLYLTWATLAWSRRGRGMPWFPRQIIQNSCVSMWSIRLGTYLFSRVLQSGEDRRFRKIKENPGMFLMTWTMQAAWVFVTLLPTILLNMKKQDKPLTYRDYLGWGLWAAGFLIEMIADQQKTNFKADPDNAGKFISTGLWSICRHPNYLGEIMIWAGLFLPASNVMRGKELFSAISPLFVIFLLTRVSGIPMLERYADKKWGATPDYQQYKANTAKLVPFIW